jgi:hypothetical protein
MRRESEKVTLYRSVPYINIFCIFFGGLDCAGHSFAYVAHVVFFRDDWIRTQRAAISSRCPTNLATHSHHLPNLAPHFPVDTWHVHFYPILFHFLKKPHNQWRPCLQILLLLLLWTARLFMLPFSTRLIHLMERTLKIMFQRKVLHFTP